MMRSESTSTELRWRNQLISSASELNADPLFGISDAVRRTFESDKAQIAVLGTTDFAQILSGCDFGRRKIMCFVDDYRVGEVFAGVEVVDSTSFIRICAGQPTLLAVNCARYDRGVRHFDALAESAGVPCVNFEQMVRLLDPGTAFDCRLSDWGPAIAGNLSRYLEVSERFNDAQSRETCYAVLLSHLTCQREWRQNICRPYSTLYFRSGLFDLTAKERFVDCGASIGESTTALISITRGRFFRSWLIEPDRLNVERLARLIDGYAGTEIHDKLSLIPVAVGERKAHVNFNHTGGHGGTVTSETDDGDVQIDTLDHLLDEEPTFIKMDLEGHEMPALRGATDVIASARPKLAISTYHRATDLLEITSFVENFDHGYKMGLRHHTEDRWDTCIYFY